LKQHIFGSNDVFDGFGVVGWLFLPHLWHKAAHLIAQPVSVLICIDDVP